MQALDAGITQCDCFRYTCAYKFTACVKSTQNGRLLCARKYGNAICSYLRNEAVIRKTPNLNTGEHDTETASMPTLSLVASVADEGRGNTHSLTHTQDNYRNPRCACAPRVNYSIHHMHLSMLERAHTNQSVE